MTEHNTNVTTANPYATGYGVTGKFEQDELGAELRQAGDELVTEDQAGDELVTEQHAGRGDQA